MGLACGADRRAAGIGAAQQRRTGFDRHPSADEHVRRFPSALPGFENQTLPLVARDRRISCTHVEPMHLGFDLSVGTSPPRSPMALPSMECVPGWILPIPVA